MPAPRSLGALRGTGEHRFAEPELEPGDATGVIR